VVHHRGCCLTEAKCPSYIDAINPGVELKLSHAVASLASVVTYATGALALPIDE
jgi:hypothetical protein